MLSDLLMLAALSPFFGFCVLLVIDDMRTMMRRPPRRREGRR